MQFFPSPSSTPPPFYHTKDMSSQHIPRSVPDCGLDTLTGPLMEPMTPPLGSQLLDYSALPYLNVNDIACGSTLVPPTTVAALPLSPAPSSDIGVCSSQATDGWSTDSFAISWNSKPLLSSSFGSDFSTSFSDDETSLPLDGFQTFSEDHLASFPSGMPLISTSQPDQPMNCFMVDEPISYVSVPFIGPGSLANSFTDSWTTGYSSTCASDYSSASPVPFPTPELDSSPALPNANLNWWPSSQSEDQLKAETTRRRNRHKELNLAARRNAKVKAQQNREYVKYESIPEVQPTGGVVSVAVPLGASSMPSTVHPPQPTTKHRCEMLNENGQRCTKSFERIEHLKRHEGTHSGIRPYQCPIEAGRSGAETKTCLKMFGRHDNLCDHYKTHLNPSGAARNVRMSPAMFYCILEQRCDPEHTRKAIAKLEKWRLEKGIAFN